MKIKYLSHCTVFLLIVFCAVFFINKKDHIAIIGAMDVEIDEIAANFSGINQKQKSDFQIITGDIGRYKIILSKSGVGKVSSAATTQYIIDKYNPIYIINVGIAGSLSPNLKAGDVIIAEKMIQHDFDLTAFGLPKGYMDNGVEPDKPTIYYSDKNLIDFFIKNTGTKIKAGTIATGDIFVTDAKLKDSIRTEFNANAVDMESAAIAQTAEKNNIPVIVLRAISDERNSTANDYKKNKQEIAKKPAQIAISVLRSDK